MADVGDAVEIIYTAPTGSAVTASWHSPDGTAVVEDVAVAENPAGSGTFPYTFTGTSPGVWWALFTAAGKGTDRFDVRFSPFTGPPPLATVDEVVELFRPLSAAEQSLTRGLLRRASAIIRGRYPDVDARVAAGTLSADTASLAAINMVLPVLRNPNGLRSESVGPFSRAFDVSRAAGLLVLTADEEALLLAPATQDAVPGGTIWARPGLAFGHLRGWHGVRGW